MESSHWLNKIQLITWIAVVIIVSPALEPPEVAAEVAEDEDDDEEEAAAAAAELLTGAMCFNWPCEVNVGRRPRAHVKCCRVLRTMYQAEPSSSEYMCDMLRSDFIMRRFLAVMYSINCWLAALFDELAAEDDEDKDGEVVDVWMGASAGPIATTWICRSLESSYVGADITPEVEDGFPLWGL